MLKLIDSILNEFQICFKRKETFSIFIIIVLGMMLRQDLRGVTSFVGILQIQPLYYQSLLHFFRSEAYDLENLKEWWQIIVLRRISPVLIRERITLIGDHIKITKEAKRMPGVKKHHQDSENAGKTEYIFGHQFGVIGVLAEGKKHQCIPLAIEMHDGKITRESFKDESLREIEEDSCVAKMIKMAGKIVKTTGIKINLLLDAYFASGTSFKAVTEINESCGNDAIVLIMRAKGNSVGYYPAEKVTDRKRGRPKIYGEKVVFSKLFEKSKELFHKITINVYGKNENIQYYCTNLLWRPAGKILRFVLVKTHERKMILICSDLNMTPEAIIQAYSYRFKIEVSFKMLKHIIGGFFYHFWTLSMPRISKFKTMTDVSCIDDELDQERILLTIRAIEVFTNIGAIAMGILTVISLEMSELIWKKYTGFLRTQSSEVPSVEIVKYVLNREYAWNFRNLSVYATLRKIIRFQRKIDASVDDISA